MQIVVGHKIMRERNEGNSIIIFDIIKHYIEVIDNN